jgi:hypothetical protein
LLSKLFISIDDELNGDNVAVAAADVFKNCDKKQHKTTTRIRIIFLDENENENIKQTGL